MLLWPCAEAQTVSVNLNWGVDFKAIYAPAMAARTLAMTVASSSSLCFAQGVQNFPLSRASKEFSTLWVSRNRASALSVNATRRDSVVVYAGKRATGPPGNGKRPRSGTQARRKQKNRVVEDDDDDAAAEKALEALFAQLEMDLNSEDDDLNEEEFTDEELTQMSKELEAAFRGMELEGLEDDEYVEKVDDGLVDMAMTDGVYEASGAATGSIQRSRKHVEVDEDEDEDDDEDDEEFVDEDDDEPRMVPLEKWQLRKLAAAAEKGRRNVNVKSLAAELGMERSDVLTFLKDPPPELLLMSAEFQREDEEAAKIPEVEFDFKVDVVNEAPRTATARKQPMAPPMPSGGPQVPRNWHGNKRLKKEHLATFERVYRQSNRPSNAMIENLVNLTHVPRKKIVQWFDDKRAQSQPKKQSFKDAPES